MNLFEALHRSATFREKEPALLFEGRSWSYGDLDDRVIHVAAALRRKGMRKGDRVCLFLPNIPEFIVSYYALQANGGVAVSVNVMNKRDEVLFIVNDCQANSLITSHELLEQVPDSRDAESLRSVYSVGKSELLPAHVEPFRKLEEAGARFSRWEDLQPSDPAALLYTSGTTGTPKGATLTQRNLVSNVFATNQHTGMTWDDVLICYLPLFHCFGQHFIMNASINAGAQLVLHRRFDPDEVLSSVQENKVSMFFGVPTIFNRLLQLREIEEKLGKTRYFFSAAATMNVTIAQQWSEIFGKVVNEGYGLTECSPFAADNHDFQYRLGSVGTPIENVEIRVVNEEDKEVEAGELGEFVIRGPNVMSGYFNRPVESSEVLRGGWLHSGDIGYQDEDGFCFIQDRVKDMINVAGFKVWPREIEEVLYQNEGVLEVAVIGVPDEDRGEAVKAVIVPHPDQRVTAEAITAFCRDRIASYKVPHLVEMVASLPKNPAGKILKKDLRKDHSRRSLKR